EAGHDPLHRGGSCRRIPRRARPRRSQQRGNAADRAREPLLGRAHDLPEHEDGRASDGRARQEIRARPDHRQQRRGLGDQRSAEGSQDHRRHESAGDSRRHHSTHCLGQPDRVLRSEWAARARRDETGDRSIAEVREQLGASRRAGPLAPLVPLVHRTAVLNVVGLTSSLIGEDTPHLAALAREGSAAPIRAVTPAVTCTAQATYLTGTLPRGHGIVANGWYFRDLAQIWFWRQANQLVSGEKVWETARRMDPSCTCAKMFWWYNMYSSADWSVTPRPIYPADGRKVPDIYSHPPAL